MRQESNRSNRPNLEDLLQQMRNEIEGVIILAGLEWGPLSLMAGKDDHLSSGRESLFKFLVRGLLKEREKTKSRFLIHENNVLNFQFITPKVTEVEIIKSKTDYQKKLLASSKKTNEILIVDQISKENAASLFHAASQGVLVITQLNSKLSGEDIINSLEDMDVSEDLLIRLKWVVSVQRFSTLCPYCKNRIDIGNNMLEKINENLPRLSSANLLLETAFIRGSGCNHCQFTGRSGKVAGYEVLTLNNEKGGENKLIKLSLEESVIRLVEDGFLSTNDLIWLESNEDRKFFDLLFSKMSIEDADGLAGLNEVEQNIAQQFQHLSEVLIAFHDINQTLTKTRDILKIAERICHHIEDLYGAKKSIVLIDKTTEIKEFLYTSGWEGPQVKFFLGNLFHWIKTNKKTENEIESRWPLKMMPFNYLDNDIGFVVPLIVYEKPVGGLIVHTSDLEFDPIQIAILQSLANEIAFAYHLFEKEKVELKLKLAREFHKNMLPNQEFEIPGFKFEVAFEPSNNTSGDFYDVIDLDDEHFAVVIADVSGKGLKAAQFMAISRAVVFSETHHSLSPREIVNTVNRRLIGLEASTDFLTLFLAVIDKYTKKMVFVRAGHEPNPVWIHDGDIKELTSKGSLINVYDPDDYDKPSNLGEETIQLAKGDKLVFCTDGYPDIINSKEESYGQEGLVKLIEEFSDLPPKEMKEKILQKLIAHQGETDQFDDMTMIIMEVK